MAGRSRYLGPFRRPLLAAWNAGNRAARATAAVVWAVAIGRVQHCECCGGLFPMLLRREVVPARLAVLWELTPRLTEALARKESLACLGCGAKLRARRARPVNPPAVPDRLAPDARAVDPVLGFKPRDRRLGCRRDQRD